MQGLQFLGGVGDNPKTVVELAMCQCSAYLRSKKEWWKDLKNEQVRLEWEHEALGSPWKVRTPSSHAEISLSKPQVEYVLDELAGYACLVDTTHGCQVSCFDRIWESDFAYNSTDFSTLFYEFAGLREPATRGHDLQKDAVTSTFVDPFLYCIVYGRTQVCDTDHLRVLLPYPVHLQSRADYFVSNKFAFLPTDFLISQNGQAKALAYINNIDPRKKPLYHSIETLLGMCIPLFSHVLTDLHRNNPLPQRIKGSCRYTEWDEPEPPEHSDDDEGWSAYERDVREWMLHRPITLPDVPSRGYPGGFENRKYTVNLRGRILQVVVDIFEIRLRPDGPGYPGSSWHVEGMENERIAACAFHYLSVENITESFIEFRTAVTAPRGFPPGDTGATRRTWAMDDGDPCHQYIGSKKIHAGLTVAFPNIYQYLHTSFKLLDPSKEGHQMVVAFYLVDPDIQPLVSTSKVPPQQKSWIKTAIGESLDVRLPVELIDKIMDEVEGLMNEDEAEAFRKEMLEDRKTFWRRSDNEHFCIAFDVWNEI